MENKIILISWIDRLDDAHEWVYIVRLDDGRYVMQNANSPRRKALMSESLDEAIAEALRVSVALTSFDYGAKKLIIERL